MPYGNYYFIETAVPQDYVVKNVKYNFSIHDSGFVDIDGTRTGTVVELTIDNFKVPSIEKSVNDAVYKQQVIPGDVVTYNLLIGLPDDIKDYHSFVITDVLDDRLTFEGFWEVEGAPTSAFMFNETGQTLTWTVTDFNALDGVQFFVINFTASINGNADSTDIPNTATINFEDSTNTGGEKPSTPVYVEPVNGSITIEKTDAETGERLPGAMFELRRGATVIGTETTDSNGMITWGNLQDGNYTIVETNAPEGYRILTEPVSVTLNSANSSVVVSITNTKIGWELPETGGMGTIIFTITGMAFMGTGMMMYRRRKLLNRI